MFPIASHSHQVVYQPVWRELSLRGHQVTVFTPNPLKNATLTNLTEIDMSSTYDIWRQDYIGEKLAKERYMAAAEYWMMTKIEEITEECFKKVQTMFEHTDFDLVIVESFDPLVYSLGCKFRVPFITISSCGVFLQTHDAVGNPTHPVLSPDLFVNVMEKFDLFKKIGSTVHDWWYRVFYYWYFLPRADKIAKRYWGRDCPYLGDLERNVSLILMNTNSLLHPVRPLLPNVVEMGKMHITSEKPLPRDLQEYLDMSTNGVVYFSLGTNVRSANLDPNVIKIIKEVLSELPYNVLWKWESDDFPDKPKNVMTRKWLPQQDVLRHKHVKVFVTQGGLQSMEEAISNCVPMVALPFIGDQPLNVMKMVQLGIGRGVNHVSMTKQELKEAIVDVSENKKYKEKIKEVSNLISDQPLTGLEKTIWWIEYVLRHKGARHLRSPAADMPWFEYHLLDVYLALFFVVSFFVYLILVCGKLLFRILRFAAKRKQN
ncbi:UDP-glycosyltransferase UGT5-like [Zophobas morio]|uniref:UDP-glycosyltransferase UGT5-like n=1 Tax=Zophobas morio TaxID=2755281 RepID=UPI003083A9D0